jgi:uncharacterized membrane protein YphA (DoxX/SURF4 family)
MNERLEHWKRIGLTPARVLIGVVFVYSGWSKLARPSEYFQLAINLYEIVPNVLVPTVALTLPWFELVFGSFLLTGYWTKGAARVLACMTACFQFLLMQAMIRDLPIDHCGCFGEGIVLTLFQSFTLDTAMLLILVQISSTGRLPFSLDSALLGGGEPPEPTPI